MKLIRATKGNFTFQLGKREKSLLFQVLRLYPRIPPATFRLSKSGKLPDADANQRLLEESLTRLREAGLKEAIGIAYENVPVTKFLYPKFNGTPVPYDATPVLTQ